MSSEHGGPARHGGAVVGAGYIGVCALVYVFQRKLQYFPTTEHPPAPSTLPPAYGDIEEFTVRTEDGRGSGWVASNVKDIASFDAAAERHCYKPSSTFCTRTGRDYVWIIWGSG